MQDLSKSISSLMAELAPEGESLSNIVSNDAAYINAVKEIWPEPVAHNMILEHTNAFYIRKDDRPRKGPDKDKPYIVCEICMDEPLVRSEMDTHREMIKLSLYKQGLSFNELRIIPARRGMRKRHPFK